ncbi:hypothetical protein MASR1M48_17220 [Lactococcus petauri]
MNRDKKIIKLINELATVRVYNSCGAFQGVMVRDQKKVYSLVKKARKLVEELQKVEKTSIVTNCDNIKE